MASRTGREKGAGRVGRPPKFDEAALRAVRQVVLDHPVAPLSELIEHVERATGVRASKTTLRKAFDQLDIVRIPPAPRGSSSSADAADVEPEPPQAPPAYGYAGHHRESGAGAHHPLGVSDSEWEVVQDIFVDPVRGRSRKYARRDMLDAMLYVLRGGISWRLLPPQYPPWHLVYKTFRRWQQQGRFQTAMRRVRRMWREREGRDAEPTGAVLDSQSVATSAQGGTKGYDAGKKVKGRKRHLLTDTLGLVLAVVVQTASIQDRDAADLVVAAGLRETPTVTKIYADSGYAGQCKQRLEKSHEKLSVEIVRRSDNRSIGRRVPKGQALLFPDPPPTSRSFEVLPKRWVIERTNGWLLRDRRLVRDQDRSTTSSEAWVWLSSAKRLLNRLCNGSQPIV